MRAGEGQIGVARTGAEVGGEGSVVQMRSRGRRHLRFDRSEVANASVSIRTGKSRNQYLAKIRKRTRTTHTRNQRRNPISQRPALD